MINVPSGARILLATRPIDFRKGAHGLAALAQEVLAEDPFWFTGEALPLNDSDLQGAAQQLGCELVVLKAVADVESRGNGFLADKRPKILFEAHVFSRLTGHQYDGTHPGISSRVWNRAG
jgi:N-acetylmuramidase